MSSVRPVALQMCPFSAFLEPPLAERFDLCRWFEMSTSARESWLATEAPRVRAVVTNGHIGCGNDVMAALPKLGIISVHGVGVDKIDLDFARARGVAVTTTPGVLHEDVADLAVGLIIALLREIPAADSHVRSGKWLQGDHKLGRRVTGRRFGVIGLGQIGSAIAARLSAFGPVAYTGPSRKSANYPYFSSVLELAKDSDVIVAACPANASTHHIVNMPVLQALGPNGYLVNIARGAVVDELALSQALNASTLAGAALDVFEHEPQVPDALRNHARVVLTPHIASATIETRKAMADLVLANLDAFLAGKPLPTPR
jgi:lactate dehydrogenase-like 2-hydroxyacid dehydrogenase